MDQIIERFNSKWKYTPGCWLWTASKNTNGYGQLKVSGKIVQAHRLSHELHIGPIPAGMHVLHRCDVPACVNPDHFFLGTHADNVADMVSKGRAARGAANGQAKLTDAQVAEIRADSRTHREIGKSHGIAPSNVWRIKHRKAWAHLEQSGA